jgi:hypothetical protein
VVAAPQRPGYSETGGVFLEDQANCAPDFLNAGRAGAADVRSAIDYMTTQPFVLKDGVVAIGHWWLGHVDARQPESPMVRATIDFLSGRGGHFRGKPNNNCQPDGLAVATAPAMTQYSQAFAKLEAGGASAMPAFAALVGSHADYPLAGFHLKRLLNGPPDAIGIEA